MQESGYYLDLKSFSVQELRELLKSIRLLPSQQVLLHDIDGRFDIIQAQGISNLAQLQVALKTKKAVASFAEATVLPLDFLTVLRREVNSYQPRPINFKDFADTRVLKRPCRHCLLIMNFCSPDRTLVQCQNFIRPLN